MEDFSLLKSIVKGKDPNRFNYVLQIEISESLEGDHYVVEKTCFCHVSISQAKYLICHSSLCIEAVVITPNHRFSSIEELRYETKKRSIPFILFSLKFEPRIKDMAIELKTDDYQCGVLNLSLDYIKFMKRMTRFKHSARGTKEKRRPVKTTFAKRCLDILVSTCMLLLLMPVFIVVSILIKISSRGPLLNVFQQAGYCYKIFDVYEFRTSSDEEAGKTWAARFGTFLRNSGLCKLPELFNVLKGDISLVGEKPLSLSEAAKLTTDKTAVRLLFTPGLTGLWGIGKLKN
jgi:lipopolysaccharide/colanic/teichoic acid biosynthesis glycosyltransferase